MAETTEKFIHPNVHRWIETKVNKKMAIEYKDELHLFLQDLWGPVVNYNFDGLKAGYPYRRKPFHDSLYICFEPMKLAFELVGDSIVEGRCSQEEYNDFLHRKNILTIYGWRVMPFCIDNLHETEYIRYLVEKLACLIENDMQLGGIRTSLY